MVHYILSDIHGNLEAFEAVLRDIAKGPRGEYLFLGDIVGYGADPERCIGLLRDLDPVTWVAGNHDWGTAGIFDLDFFNNHAREAVLWAQKMLGRDEKEFLKSMPITYETNDLTLVHGSLVDPKEFRYIFGDDDARLSFKLQKNNLCFVGHSHVPGIFCCGDGEIVHADSPEVIIDRVKKYIINAGSIGQPRDGDPRASYVMYDDRSGSVRIRRIPYNIDRAQDKIIKAGLPRYLAHRLQEGR